MSRRFQAIRKHRNTPNQPRNEYDAQKLQGWGPDKASPEEAHRFAESQWETNRDAFADFSVTGATESSAGKSVRLWEPFRQVTGMDPDLTPQPTGNCVAAAADDVVEGTQCVQILAGARERFQPIYNPFHYATGRVLVGKNALRGRGGSIGSWQATALKVYGAQVLDAKCPEYNKRNVDAWGNDKNSDDGQSFRDHLESAKENVVQATARVTTWEQIRDALFAKCLLTIARSGSFFGMRPDKQGFHVPGGNASHQISIWAYSEVGEPWVGLKNQWGDLHGELRDFETEELWPRGFLRVRLAHFLKYYLPRSEVIVYSGFSGFPQLHLDRGGMA